LAIHLFATDEYSDLLFPIPAGIDASQLRTHASASSTAAAAFRSTFLAAIPHPMSTPTAEGMTADSVGITEPIVAP